MTSMQPQRPWRLQLGRGARVALVLPRMDPEPPSESEWTEALAPWLDDLRFHVLDLPELRAQLHHDDEAQVSIADLARDAREHLRREAIRPDMIWGVSIGGMIAQHLAASPEHAGVPLVLVSTYVRIDPARRALFSSWSLLVERYGVEAYRLAIAPWLRPSDAPPIFSRDEWIAPRADTSPVAVRKLRASLRAVAHHDARDRLPGIAAPALVLIGERSVLVDHRDAAMFAELLPRARVERVPGSAMRVLSGARDTVAPLLRAFIREHLP